MKHSSDTKMSRVSSKINIAYDKSDEEFMPYSKIPLLHPKDVLNGMSFEKNNQRSSSSCSAYNRLTSLNSRKCGNQ